MWIYGRILFFGFLLFSSTGLFGITLAELRSRPKLTPEQFGSCFKNFQFVFHAEIQDPEVFLKTQSGDCDDYATLAATILHEKGYTSRLIAIRMPGIVHVVCYIEETHSYLDYNERHSHSHTVKAGSLISDIAQKVSRSFGAPWSSASEFTFDGNAKQLVATVLETQPRPLAASSRSLASTRTAPLFQ